MVAYRVADDPSDIVDLWNEEDEFGEDDDVLVIIDSYGPMGPVATYDSDDLIVLNNKSTGFDGPVCGGRDDDDIIGGAGADVLVGGTGEDVVLGRGGNDEIFNDRGDDFYRGGAGADFIHFSVLDADRPFEGVANVEGVTCSLAKRGPQDLGIFGSDIIRGIENIFGGAGDDTFTGNDFANVIEGRDGNDTIRGAGGDDILFAFNGADTLTGGRGADTIVLHEPGSPARDVVVYGKADSGITAATRDTVNDFDFGGGASDDVIDLSFMPGTATFVGTAGTGAAGEVSVSASGADTLVRVDSATNNRPEMTILLTNVDPASLSAADFML
jgi:Ca2+-binding RTX toxin-like protein